MAAEIDVLIDKLSTHYIIGQIVPVKDAPAFDFTTAKTFGRDIGDTPNDGFDYNYCITSPGDVTKLQARYTY